MSNYLTDCVKLNYSIHSYSGHTASYTPEKILIDDPSDQTSRWTGATGVGSESLEDKSKSKSSRTSSPADGSSSTMNEGKQSSSTKKKEVQFITLELEKPCVVKFVGFGKYHRVHPCNLSQMSIYGGMSPDPKHMELLYHGGLKNDSVSERILLEIWDNNLKGHGRIVLPVKYIRIDAHAAHSQNYNVSIWHVFLEGSDGPEYMKQALTKYESYRTMESSHLILAHLRRSCLLTPYYSLLTSLPPYVATNFEHQLITSLHTSLVLQGNYSAPLSLSSTSSSTSLDAESILEQCLEAGLFKEWSPVGGKGKSVARWECLHPGDSLGLHAPSPRGGHQMVIVGRKILLFGGWDGEKDLGDLWEWDLGNSEDEEDEDGEVDGRTRKGWKRIDETFGSGVEGVEKQRKPRGRSCHQFVVDEETGWVYLLGGMGPPSSLTSTASTAIPIEIATEAPIAVSTSTAVETENDAMEVEADEIVLKVEPKKELNPWNNDFWRYKATGERKGTWELISEDVSVEGGPKLLFDHQMVIDRNGGRLYIFGGKYETERSESASGNESVYSGVYSYDLIQKKWTSCFQDPAKDDPLRSQKLVSRMGAAMFFDPSISGFFIFSGQRASSNLRDLWKVKVFHRHSPTLEKDLSENKLKGHSVAPVFESRPDNTSIILQAQMLASDYTNSNGHPPSGFAQRVSLDVESGDWTLLSGLLQDPKTGADLLSEDVWIRNKLGAWQKVEVKGISPRGRYACPVLYDSVIKEHYMMGGNPQDADKSKRLSDLWRLTINKPSPKEAVRKAKFLIRKQKFDEMCQTQSSVSALTYLQTQLAAVVDHSDEDEASAFRACMISLMSAPLSNNHDDSTFSSPVLGSSTSSLAAAEDPAISQVTSTTLSGPSINTTASVSIDSHLNSAQIAASAFSNLVPEISIYTQRHELFEKLLEFFPENEVQPTEDLRNMCGRRQR